MSRFPFGSRFLAVAALALMTASTTSLSAQIIRRTRRETNANRRARIQRQIQETYAHTWEAAGGGGYLRFHPGEFLKRNNEVTFFGTGTYYRSQKFGLLGDVHGAYGNANAFTNNIYSVYHPQISEYVFSAGPTYRFYAGRKVALSVFGTGGAAYGKFDQGTKGIPPTLLGIYPAEWRATFTGGLNLDYNFYPNLAARFAPTYIGTTFGGRVQSNVGFNVGLVYRFGKLR